jgi:uncharacterized protein YdiU (UPF0061 family)
MACPHEIDEYFKVLNKMKQRYEELSKDIQRDIGAFEYAEKTVKTGLEKFVVKIAKTLMSEQESRMAEDLTLLELFLKLLSEQARDINTLTQVVSSLVSSNEVMQEKVESVADKTKEYDEIMSFLKKWKDEKEQEEKEKEKYR